MILISIYNTDYLKKKQILNIKAFEATHTSPPVKTKYWSHFPLTSFINCFSSTKVSEQRFFTRIKFPHFCLGENVYKGPETLDQAVQNIVEDITMKSAVVFVALLVAFTCK